MLTAVRNSSQTERNDAEVLVRLLSAGDGSGSASKEKVFRKQRCLHNSSLKSASTTKHQRTQCLQVTKTVSCAAELAESAPVLRPSGSRRQQITEGRGGGGGGGGRPSPRASAAVAAEAVLMLKSVAKLDDTFR